MNQAENAGEVGDGPMLASVVDGFALMQPEAILNKYALAKTLGRHWKTVERAVRRGELPPPFRMLGKSAWRAGTIVEHFAAKQAAAVKLAAQRDLRRPG